LNKNDLEVNFWTRNGQTSGFCKLKTSRAFNS